MSLSIVIGQQSERITLPEELCRDIYDFAINGAENQDDTLSNISLVDKASQEAIRFLVEGYWMRLKKWSFSNCLEVYYSMKKSESKYYSMINGKSKYYSKPMKKSESKYYSMKKSKSEYYVIKNIESFGPNPRCLFKLLIKRLYPLGASQTCFLTWVDIEARDSALYSSWPKIKSALPEPIRIALQHNYPLENAGAIRKYINIIGGPGPTKILLSQIRALYLNTLKLSIIPHEIIYFPGLTILDLSNNKIEFIPEELLPINLENLSLNRNKIRTANFSALTCLEALDLSGNEISVIPNSISDLTRLKWLSLNGNKIEAIPDFIYLLPRLTHLYLSSNKISTIVFPDLDRFPLGRFSFPSLQVLDLSNKLKQ